MGRGDGKICQPEYKFAEEEKAASSGQTSALALVVVLSPAALSSLCSLLQAWGLCLCPASREGRNSTVDCIGPPGPQHRVWPRGALHK